MGSLPFTPQEKQNYLVHQYGYPVFRYWDSLPQPIRDGFDWGENNPIWNHSYFLGEAERKLTSMYVEGASKEVIDAAFNKIVADYSSPEMTPELMAEYRQAIEASITARTEAMRRERGLLDSYIGAARAEHPGIRFKDAPLSTPEELAAYKAEYGETATGNGVFMGEMGVVRSTDKDPVIATDYLMDCVAVVLTAENPEKPGERIAVLAHVDATTDISQAMGKMLGQIPEGYKIDASLLGSSRNDNAFMNTEIAHALVESGRIQSLSVNVNGPTTVAVDARTGTILTADVKGKREANAYSIDPEADLPVKVEFDGARNSSNFGSYRDNQYMHLRRLRPDSELYSGKSELALVVHPEKEPERMASPKALFNSLTSDGHLSRSDLKRIAKDIQSNLRTDVCVAVDGISTVAELKDGNRIHLGYNGQDKVEDTGPVCTR